MRVGFYLLTISLLIFGCTNDPINEYELKISASPSEAGEINPSSGNYEEGTEITIRVSTNQYYEFDKWSGSWSGSENPLTITMDGNKTLIGYFKLQDSDGDGITDDIDQCNTTPSGQTVDENGCSDSQKDTDRDGITDDIDQCPETNSGSEVDQNGCADYQKDSDGDGVTDDLDQCPETVSGRPVDESGCQMTLYLDTNGVTIKAYEWAEVGDTGVIENVEYVIVDESQLFEIVSNNENFENICTSKVTNLSGLFFAYQSSNYRIKSWDVSNVEDMSDMFYDSNYFDDVSYWDTSSVLNMERIFARIRNNWNISNWNVSNVTNMSGAFYGIINTYLAFSFNGIDLSSWDVSSVENMAAMFANTIIYDGRTNKTWIDLFGDISSWDVSSVKDMSYMFYVDPQSYVNNGASRDLAHFLEVDLSSWDVSNIENITGMFAGQNIDINLSNWDTSKILNMSYTFATTWWPEKLSIENWDTSNVINMDGMFDFSEAYRYWGLPPCLSGAGAGFINIPLLYPDLTKWNFQSIQSCRQFFFFYSTYQCLPNYTIQEWDIIGFLQHMSQNICNWMEPIN